MLNKTCLLAALAMCASAHAYAAQWRVTWTGFQFDNIQEPYFDPSHTVTGTFSGIDTNGDDAISLDEVTELTFGGRDYAACTVGPGFVCSLPHFYYSAAEGLSVIAQYDEYSYTELGGMIHTSHYAIDTTLGIYYEAYGESGSYAYYFTPDTITTITLLNAVPEPQAYAMFGIGMLLLAGAARRHGVNGSPVVRRT